MKTISSPWTLTVVPHRLYRTLTDRKTRELRTSADLPASSGSLDGAVTIPAAVPGNFELDLVRAGLLPDPFFGTDISRLRDLEDRHLFYATLFDAPDGAGDGRAVLHFEGIDTVADVYVNGRKIGHAENMLVDHAFAVDGLRPAGNELLVHITPTMIHAQGADCVIPPAAGAFKYNFASLHVRKAPSSFGWDILCHAVSGGLWRPVWIEAAKAPPHLDEVFLYTYAVDPGKSRASLCLYYAFQTDHETTAGYEISVEGRSGDAVFSAREDVWHTSGHFRFEVPGARLWYPRNAGEPHLYDVVVTLWRNGSAVDRREFRTGLRVVELDRTSLVGPDGSGEFRFLVNHRPVFVMGTNWVPLDAFHGRDAERLPRALELLLDIGCNAVRCWGGNVYEDHAFFDFCDEHGILVWQDFAMGCAYYPQDDGMQRLFRDEVLRIVRKLRNHASLCLWAGDNECDFFWKDCFPFRRDPAGNALTRRVIPEVLQAEDFTRPYLPSSPYLDPVAFAADGENITEHHLWGPRDYFKGPFYSTANCRFASETGYHGCPDPETLRTFIPEDELWPIYDQGTPEDPFRGTPKPSWHLHQTAMEPDANALYGYRIPLMTSQVRHMFRDIPRDLDTYARMSQLSQAEAFKYFIERFRVAKWRKTGIIWWNLLDGWPQISDAVVNYDFTKKLAYDFIRRAQRPVLLAVDDPGADGLRDLHAVNDSREAASLAYRVSDAGETLAEGRVRVPADGNVVAARLDLEGREDHVLLLEWTDAAGARSISHYIAQPRALDYAAYTAALAACGILPS